MSSQRREVLRGFVQHRKKGTNQWKKRSAVAYCGGAGAAVAQVELFDEGDEGSAKAKAKRTILLADAKIDTLSPPSTPCDSSPQGSVVGGTGASPAGLSPLPNTSKFEFHVSSSGELHEFRCQNEEDRASWVKLLGLLVLFPTSYIPEEPQDNPIKDSFRNKLSSKDFKADSVWPVFILAEEVSTKLNIIGLQILVLKGSSPNYPVGAMEVVSPADNNVAVSWERDKLRRTGKTGNLVFVEIGRRCKGGPGLVWLYTGVELAQSLRETLHNFLFHGDGKAIGIPLQQKVPTVDVPKPSVDSLPPLSNRRSSASASSGYHSQTVTSPPSISGSPSVRSETVPPVHLDQHPGRLGRQASAPCDINPMVSRRSVSQPTTAASSSGHYHIPRCFSSAHSEDSSVPVDYLEEDQSFPVGQLDQEATDGGGVTPHLQQQQRRRSVSMPTSSRSGHSHTSPTWQMASRTMGEGAQATAYTGGIRGGGVGGGGGDEYEQMVHPGLAHRSVYKDSDYVYMHPAVSRIPESQSPTTNSNSGYSRDNSGGGNNYSNYDFVPASSLRTIKEAERPGPYENQPLPRELQNAVPIIFQPKYENVEAAKRSRSGSTHLDCYENVLANGEQMASLAKGWRGEGVIYENVPPVAGLPDDPHYLRLSMQAKREGVNPSVARVQYDKIDVNMTNGVQTLQRERTMERGVRS